MFNYIDIITKQYKSRKNFYHFLIWIVFRIKKFLKVGYKGKKINFNNKVDIVIPTISKDFHTLSLLIESLKFLQHKINKIYIVAPYDE